LATLPFTLSVSSLPFPGLDGSASGSRRKLRLNACTGLLAAGGEGLKAVDAALGLSGERPVLASKAGFNVVLAAGVGVEICGWLVLSESVELRSDDGGEGVDGDEEFPAALSLPNCDMIWLNVLLVDVCVVVTVFFDTEICSRPGEAAGTCCCCFCSKMEIRSEIGVLPDWLSLAAILFLPVKLFRRFLSVSGDKSCREKSSLLCPPLGYEILTELASAHFRDRFVQR
jgi:hypothetical protein